MKTIETIQDRIHEKAAREAVAMLREMVKRWSKDLRDVSAAEPYSLIADAYATDKDMNVKVRLSGVLDGLEKCLLEAATVKRENELTAEFFAAIESMEEKFEQVQQYTHE